jgi:hypothetical protein
MSPSGNSGADIDITVNKASLLAQFREITAAYADVGKGIAGANERADASLAKFSQSIIQFGNRAEQAQKRYIQSLELTAANYGKNRTEVERLSAAQDALLKRYQGHENVLKAINSAYATMKQRAKEAEDAAGRNAGSGAGGQSGALAFRAARDFFEGRTAFAEVQTGKLLQSLSGLPLVLGSAAVGFAALGVAAVHAYEALGKYGVEVSAVEARTGLSAHQVEQFRFAAERAGEDVSIFERAMRGLTQAAFDQSAAGDKARGWLERFGIDSAGLRDGTVTTATAMQKLGEGFASISNPIDRTRAEMELLKRIGIESGPVFLELTANLKRFDNEGLGKLATNENITKFKEYDANWAIFTAHVREARMEAQMLLAALLAIAIAPQQQGAAVTNRASALIGAGALAGGAIGSAFGPGGTAVGALAGGAAVLLTPNRRAPDQPSYVTLPGIGEMTANPFADLTPALRAQSQAALDRYHASQGLDWKIKEAERQLAATREPMLGDSPEQIAARQSAERALDALRAQKRSSAQQDALADRIRAIAAEESDRGEYRTPTQRAYAEFAKMRDSTTGKAPSAAQLAEVAGYLTPRFDIESREAVTKAIARAREETDKAAIATGYAVEGVKSPEALTESLRRTSAASAEQFVKLNRTSDRYDTEAVRAYTAAIVESNKAEEESAVSGVKLRSISGDQSPRARLEVEKQIAAIRSHYTTQDFETAQSKLQAELSVAGIEQDRRTTLETELFTLRMKHVNDLAKLQEQVDEQHAQLIKTQTDEIKGQAERLYTTLFTHPAKFGKQLGTTLHTEILKPITGGLGEMTAQALHPLIFGSTGTGGIAGAMHIFGGAHTSPIGTPSDPVSVSVVNVTHAATSTGFGYAGGYGGATVRQGFHGSGMIISALLGGSLSQVLGGGGGGAGGGGPRGQVTYGSSDITGLTPGDMLGGGGGGSFGSGMSAADLGGGGTVGGWPTGSTGGGGTAAHASLLSRILGGGAGGTNRFNLAALKQNWFNSGSIATGGGGATTAAGIGGLKGDLAGILTSQGAASLEVAAGLPLGMAGLTGVRRGTAGGLAESIGGGALTGAGIGTMILPGIGTAIGAGIGAAAGGLASLGEMLAGVESPRHEAIRLVKDQYHITISNAMADRIVQLAQSKYGNTVSLAVRSPEVRQMLGLYAAGTGQAGQFPQGASVPHGANLMESGGTLYQAKSYLYGNAYSQPSSLPVYGGSAGSTVLPPAGGSPVYVSMNFDGKNAGDAMTGQFVTPSFVQTQQTSAWNASAGRTDSSMMMAEPGSLVS